MEIRPLRLGDIDACWDLVNRNWGFDAAQRFARQAGEAFGGKEEFAPVFVVAEGDLGVIGFAAYQPSMKMKGSYDFIWIAIHPKYQKMGVGKLLTDWRVEHIRQRGGTMIELVTQKPDYFSRHGFFKLHHLDNGWYLMLKIIGRIDI